MTKQVFTYGDVTYSWCGDFGAIFKSREHGVRVGDTRVIFGELFYVSLYYSRGWLRSSEVYWSKIDITAEQIRALKARLFDVVV